MRKAWNESRISFARGERVTMDLFVSIREEDETLRPILINYDNSVEGTNFAANLIKISRFYR